MNEKQGPAHIERLNTIAKLKAEGFEGPDKSLNESIFGYRIAWRQLTEAERFEIDQTAAPGKTEFLFVYRNNNGFDRCSIVEKDLTIEFNWINDWEELYSFVGLTAEEWSELPFPHKIQDLVCYYGRENIFGESYYSFKIEE